MAHEIHSAAILFADVCGSTRLYEVVGNEEARSLVADTLARLGEVTARHQGTVVKSIGDEVLCTFPSASHATLAAMDMNRAVDQLRRPSSRAVGPLCIHTGLHVGPVLWEDADVFGDAVNLAARIVALAKPRQILATKDCLDAMRPDLRGETRFVDRIGVKGRAGEVEVYEVVWESQDMTVSTDPDLLASIAQALAAHTRLELSCGDRRKVVDVLQPCASLGRLPQNDLCIEGALVSRYHARVEFHRGRFVLVDQSWNGTYLHPEGGETLFLKREEASLTGSGLIGLGEAVTPDSPQAIRFAITS